VTWIGIGPKPADMIRYIFMIGRLFVEGDLNEIVVNLNKNFNSK